jgi:hypothetical protein
VKSSFTWNELLSAMPLVAVAAAIWKPPVTTTIIEPGTYVEALMPSAGGSKYGSLSRLTAVRLKANRSALTVLLPKTFVSPSVSDCARLSIDGFTVVRTLPVVP